MQYTFDEIKQAASSLADLPVEERSARHPLFKDLTKTLKSLPANQKPSFGQQLNHLRSQLEADCQESADQPDLAPIDVTASLDVNQDRPPKLLSTRLGSRHPIQLAQDEMLAIFANMGFSGIESRQLDNEYYMFDSLNFPADHPARDEYDTFTIAAPDGAKSSLVAPSHTSTMQNRVLRASNDALAKGQPIATVVAGRVFRREDVDASHDHTFYQIEGIYVDKGVSVAHLIATLKEFVQAYYGRQVDIKIQPFYFPFTEPSFEFAFSCPFCLKLGCRVCSQGWIEILGCGAIHPNVLSEAGIDPKIYSGFAFGIGFMRLVMTKYGIEDIRHFGSGKLEFLRQF